MRWVEVRWARDEKGKRKKLPQNSVVLMFSWGREGVFVRVCLEWGWGATTNLCPTHTFQLDYQIFQLDHRQTFYVGRLAAIKNKFCPNLLGTYQLTAVVVTHIFKGIWCNLSNVLYSMVSIEFACHFDVNLLFLEHQWETDSILGQPCCSWWTNYGLRNKLNQWK